MPISHRAFVSAIALTTLLAPLAPAAQACTRILWNTNKLGVYVGRTMDFPVSTELVSPCCLADWNTMVACSPIPASTK